jgi:superfamily II DNA/RNA helicase
MKREKEKQQKSKNSKVEQSDLQKRNRENKNLNSKQVSDYSFSHEKDNSKEGKKDPLFGTKSFAELGLTPEALKALESMNITRPTHIQVSHFLELCLI